MRVQFTRHWQEVVITAFCQLPGSCSKLQDLQWKQRSRPGSSRSLNVKVLPYPRCHEIWQTWSDNVLSHLLLHRWLSLQVNLCTISIRYVGIFCPETPSSMLLMRCDAVFCDRWNPCLGSLENLGRWWRRQLCLEDSVPEATGDAKAILVVHEVMLKVILLQFTVVCRQASKSQSSEKQ